MQELQSESIDLIYCDILYGTGRKFTDYQDLKADKKVIEDFYLPRIKEMHRLLKNTGSIYLQMDTKINHWMRCLLDDVFGYDNFRNELIWTYETAGRRSKQKFTKKHDCILFYGMGNDTLKDCKHLELIENNYSGYYEDENGWYQLTGVGDYSDSSILRLKTEGKIHINGKNKPYLKIYLTKKNGKLYKEKQLPDVWDDIAPFGSVNLEMKNQKVDYDTQKPIELLRRIIKASSSEGETVADFFLGSGTTAVVCKELNRKFIVCDINPKAIELTNKRLNETLL